MDEWVLCALGAGLFMGWGMLDQLIPGDGFEKGVARTGINTLAAFVGGMLFMWSFVLAERFWLAAALATAGFIVGMVVAVAMESLRFWIAYSGVVE